MTIAGLWKYGDWRHVATGCTAVVCSESDYYVEFSPRQISHLEYDLTASVECVLFAGLHQCVVRPLTDVNAIR